jgi:CubicO group peptidase (beta-lactamase class C family)
MQSVTKSVTAAIVGVAIGRGDFPSLDTPVLRFFEDTTVANVDDRKRGLTIRHLLTMTTGLDWREGVDCPAMEASFDWVRFVIDKPMAHAPVTWRRSPIYT